MKILRIFKKHDYLGIAAFAAMTDELIASLGVILSVFLSAAFLLNHTKITVQTKKIIKNNKSEKKMILL